MPDAAERAFRVLLRLYPASFRARFGQEMVDYFLVRWRRIDGTGGRLRFAARTLTDAVRSAVRERVRWLTPGPLSGDAGARGHRGGALASDLRYAVRMLRRKPGFTAMAALTLALGIGANVAVFSLTHAMFLAPLPFRESDRLVAVWERRSTSNDANLPLSGHEYAALRDQNRVFDGVSLYTGEIQHLTGSGDPEAIQAVRASANFFRTLGTDAAIGRVFVDGEDGPGAARVAVLGHAFWRRRFGGDRTIVGRGIVLNDETFTVIGVTPPLPSSLEPAVFLPLDLPAQIRAVGRHNLQALARLAPEVTLAQADEAVNAIAARLASAMPENNTDHRFALIPVRDEIAGEFRTAFTALLAAVGCVLLIGCANVANLLLTRSAGRQREMAVRMALGATRLRIVRQLLAESVLLAAIGGVAGLLLASWIVDVVPTLAPSRIPLIETARIDWRMFAVAAGLSIATGLAAGLAPAMRSSRTHPQSLHGSRVADDPEQRRLRSLLVAAEVALTLVLLLGAGLLINSFVRLVTVDPGFKVNRVLVLGIDLPGTRYSSAASRRGFVDRLLSEVRSIPGTEAVGATSQLPLGGADNWMPFTIEGRPAPAPGAQPYAAFRVVTPDYFRALDVPLRAGRFFTDADARIAIPLVRWFAQQPLPAGIDASQPMPVALVSETAARQFWPGEDPVGRRFRTLFSPDITIVGLVGDVHHNALNAAVTPHIYLSHNQEPWGSLSVVVRTSGAPMAVAAPIRDQLRALDPSLPVGMRTMDEVVAASVGEPRFHVLLIAVFGAVALTLAIVGIVGVVSYAATQRTREIGVRIALGAQRHEIATLMIGQGMRPIVAGLVAGTVVALYLTRFIETMLFGVEPADPLTFSSVVALLGLVALLACWLPAQRASRVDPVTTLRAE
jgi:putative ABC transport system permease protein